MDFENKKEVEVVEEKAKKGWNWGAFLMPLQFGIANKAYMTFLMLVPLLNFVWPFICGIKGAEWAYESGLFKNIDEFNGAMKSWNRIGFVMFVLILVLIIFYILIFAFIINITSQLLS
jgi:hypothetical protein